MSDLYPDVEIGNIQTKNLENTYKPLGLTIKCNIPQMAQQNEDFLYCPSLVIPSLTENPFQNEKRG